VKYERENKKNLVRRSEDDGGLGGKQFAGCSLTVGCCVLCYIPRVMRLPLIGAQTNQSHGEAVLAMHCTGRALIY
jgi:hypothetical protein